MGNTEKWNSSKGNSQITNTKVSQVLAVKSADTRNSQLQGIPKTTHTHTHCPQSAISEGKMKAQEKEAQEPYIPTKHRLCSYYWSYFHLFTEMLSLAVPSQ